MERLTEEALQDLCVRALQRAGYSEENAAALARQAVMSDAMGQPALGVAHLFDYVDAIGAGRVDGYAEPLITRPAPAIIHVDGQGGVPQTGFDRAFEDIVAAAHDHGLAAFLQSDATTCSALGTFPLRLAERGLVALAATNGFPLLAGSGSTRPVFCTNPMAFAAPQADGPPLLIDQSSSSTAFVNIREADARGEAIPEGWAVDADGRPTTDPAAAREGALLPFGGARGGNIALMVEIMAAGLTGARWSLDAPSLFEGRARASAGLCVVAMDPEPAARGFASRLGRQLRRLGREFGVHIPGLAKGRSRTEAAQNGIEVDESALARLRRLAAQ